MGTMGTFSDRGGSCSCVAGLVIVGFGLFGLGLATGMFFPWTECEAGGEQGQIYDQDTTPSTPIPIGTQRVPWNHLQMKFTPGREPFAQLIQGQRSQNPKIRITGSTTMAPTGLRESFALLITVIPRTIE